LGAISDRAFDELEVEERYGSYLERQRADVAAFERDENLRLPADMDYTVIGGLSAEVRGKLAAVRPSSLGAAARIPGMTPAALNRLLGYVRARSAA
jgi:tRNA uridine 5-carboxymethylaminomethyl modification enzyme